MEKVVSVLEDMTQDWDLDFDEPLGEETRIVADLGFESVDLMQLIVAVDQAFSTRNLPFDQVFMEDGSYVDEITVKRLVSFLEAALPNAD